MKITICENCLNETSEKLVKVSINDDLGTVENDRMGSECCEDNIIEFENKEKFFKYMFDKVIKDGADDDDFWDSLIADCKITLLTKSIGKGCEKIVDASEKVIQVYGKKEKK